MLKKLVNFLILFALVVCVSGTVAFLSAPTAHAGGTCSGTRCDGLDPHTTQCDQNPYTLTGVLLSAQYGSYVNLRGDNTCSTNWTKVVTYNNSISQTLHIARAAGNPGSGVNARVISNSGLDCSNFCWSDQLYATYEKAQACFFGYNDQYGNIDSPYNFCTNWT